MAVVQIDCAGRGKLMFADKVNETIVAPLQQVLGKEIPRAGFHCFGEIAPLSGRARYHNYTGVLIAIYEPRFTPGLQSRRRLRYEGTHVGEG